MNGLPIILRCVKCGRYCTPEEAHYRTFQNGVCVCGGAFMVWKISRDTGYPMKDAGRGKGQTVVR